MIDTHKEIRREGNTTNKTARMSRYIINQGVGVIFLQGNGKAKKRGSLGVLISVNRTSDPPPPTASTHCAVEVCKIFVVKRLLHHVDDDRTVEVTSVYSKLPAGAAGFGGASDAGSHTLRVDTSLRDERPAFVDWAVKWALLVEPFVV